MSSEMDPSTITIAALYWQSIASFNRLLDHFKNSQDPPETLSDDFGRLKVWAENVAAHRRGDMSLDHRLREASEVMDRVKALLGDLNDVLEDTLSISLDDTEAGDHSQSAVEPHSTGPETVDSDSDDEIRATSPLKEAVKEIGNVIECLYRLSITVQSPASASRLERIEKIDVSHFESFDVDYVSNKFPLGEDYRYLIERLGKANTKRRQMLKYHNEHHVKIVGRRVAVGDGTETESYSEDQDDFYSEAPTDMRTTVSTVNPANVNLIEVVPVDLDSRSEAGFSTTSYASSSANPGSLRVPAPPPGYDKGPFQCPYCFIIVETENRASWKKHVFQDLRPYVCTFKDCPQGTHLYKGRHEWFDHEREMHRREWFCSKCKKSYPSSDQFRQHLVKKHKGVVSSTKEQLEVLIARGERATEGKEKCPLCPEKHALKLLRSHLGRHLEHISLFILPEASEDNEDSDSNHHSDDDDTGTAPDTKSKTSSIAQTFKQQYFKAQTYLKTGTGINEFDKDGWAPIHKAAKSGDLKWVTFLLDSGCDSRATTKDKAKMEPLHIAAATGHEHVLKLLLSRDDIEVDSKDNNGKTAFAWACQRGHEGAVKLLLSRDDIEVNAKDNDGYTAFLWACQNGHEGVVKLLLSRDDIEINTKSNNGNTAFLLACYNGHEGVVKLLLSRDDIEVNAKNNDGNTAFLTACANGQEGVVKQLLSRDDIEVNAKNNFGNMAFLLACYYGNEGVVKLLLPRDDIEVNSKDNNGNTAFLLACYNGQEGVVKLLLSRDDIEVNAKDSSGRTSFLLACYKGHESAVKLLLSRDDIQVNAKDNDGNTAFLSACRHGHEDVVKLLLSQDDIEVNAKDSSGRTAFLWACHHGHEGVVKLLLSRDDIEVNAKNKFGNTAFLSACYFGYEGVVKLLLSRDDIEVNAKDKDGNSGLMLAQQKKHFRIEKLVYEFVNNRGIV